jgi:hypothetical protein
VSTLSSTIDKSPQHTLSLFQPAVSSPAVPWQRLVTVEILQLHALKSFLHRLSYTADSVAQIVFLITPLHGPSRKHRFQQYIVACVSVAAGTCLLSRCLETNVVSEPFASNGCFSGSTVLVLRKYATILYKYLQHNHVTLDVYLRVLQPDAYFCRIRHTEQNLK